jgi:beta-galactosidase
VRDVREGPFDAGASLNGQSLGYTVGGVGWYRKHWTLADYLGEGSLGEGSLDKGSVFTKGGNPDVQQVQQMQLLPGQRVSLRFDGVYEASDVYLNGHLVGHHPYGYTGFEYDVTDFLRLDPPEGSTEGSSKGAVGGAAGGAVADGQQQVLAVRVNNYGKNSRWYSGSGIYRHGKRLDREHPRSVAVALPKAAAWAEYRHYI